MKIATFEEFWPYYLSQHAHPWTRRCHVAGTLIGLGTALGLILTGQPEWALLGLIPGYGIAWLSHGLIEKNRPATWTYPLWSLKADFILFARVLTGRPLQ